MRSVEDFIDTLHAQAFAEQQKKMRDDFAMAALAGMLGNTPPLDSVSAAAPKYAKYAYIFADAMMKERDQ